jgi:hypothetical protein
MSSQWSLSPDELDLVAARPARQRVGFALQLKVHSLHKHFFDTAREVPVDAIEIIAGQLARPITDALVYDWAGRTGRRHREEILALSGAKPMPPLTREELRLWLLSDICPMGLGSSAMVERAAIWCAQKGCRPPQNKSLIASYVARSVTLRRVF